MTQNRAGSSLAPAAETRRAVLDGSYDEAFRALYPREPAGSCRARYAQLLASFIEAYGGGRLTALVSAPGRTEVCGNHTDHQRGRALAAAVDMDTIAAASPNGTQVVSVVSEGYRPATVDLGLGLVPREDERGRSNALVRGVIAWHAERGMPAGGFDAVTSSRVLRGSGLSSSAAFEVLLGTALDALFGTGATARQIAVAGRHAENAFYGKPSGLLDQMASSVGGFVRMDFKDPEEAIVEPVQFDMSAAGLELCVVDTGGSHADLTQEYAAIPSEMRSVAAWFGKDCLRDVDPCAFHASVGALRDAVGDRAVLRAMHFFSEDALVDEAAAALRLGDTARFLACVVRSGRSSQCRLQNAHPGGAARVQGVSLGLAMSERLLDGKGGAWRVHGGGFAGTIQAFVPRAGLPGYRAAMDAAFGEGACHVLAIRPVGGASVLPVLA